VGTTGNHSTKLKYAGQLHNIQLLYLLLYITQPSDVQMENELQYPKQSMFEAQMTIFEE
jgi:hypothetical protein